MNKSIKKLKIIFAILCVFITSIFLLTISAFAENINISYNYGIKNIAKDFSDLPININIENKDSQVFSGYMTIDVFENNNSIYTYRIDVEIPAKASSIYNRSITVSNLANTVVFNLYNRREDLIVSERTNIDLSYYSDKLIIGAIADDYDSLSYIDNLNIENVNIQTKLAEVDIKDVVANNKILNVLDMLIITSGTLENEINDINQALYTFLTLGKPIIFCLDENNKLSNVPNFLSSYVKYNRTNIRQPYSFNNSKSIYDDSGNIIAYVINIEDEKVVFANYSFKALGKQKDGSRKFSKFIEKCFGIDYFTKFGNNYNMRISNDYYNISNLLNMIDRNKLPDIFVLTALLFTYILFLTLILYVLLRNINKREKYGKYALIFSILYTIFMFSIGFSVMKKNTFLTFLSIVNIKDSNAKEMAFLNFRTSESGNYKFDTSIDNSLNPILKKNKEPIISFNFVNRDEIKSTTFTESDGRIMVDVENTKDFDSNVFTYVNNNYLNDIYNIDVSFKRFDGEIIGRITNNMNVDLKNASLLMYGKILKIGDIESNHSISLSRANTINSTVNNNAMLSEILADANNKNIVKYYLDEHVIGYYDYGLLFGFIDDNLTIDINSSDVGEVYGRTLIVTKVNNNYMTLNDNVEDYCSLEYDVNTIEGNYDKFTNTTDGNSTIVNEYSFDDKLNITKLYLERMDSYDYGQLEFDIPFYGNIEIFNYIINSYENLVDDVIDGDRITNYLNNNKITLRFTPTVKDPLYRKISVPILRVLANS